MTEFLAVTVKRASATADARQRVKIHEWKFHFVIIARSQLLQTVPHCSAAFRASDCVRVVVTEPLRASQRGTYFRRERSRRVSAQVHAEDLLGDCPIYAATMRDRRVRNRCMKAQPYAPCYHHTWCPPDEHLDFQELGGAYDE
jgi:hypothetical protein